MNEPTCAKCGGPMTPHNARLRPELFYHDDCLPDEFRPPQGKPTQPDPVLDALEDVLNFTLSLIRSQPCRCQVTHQGLQVCRRCLIAGKR